ncbi:hypothetical protein PIB30_108441, partial [Stylosanthes scabra]|nr:hypothetical protein [Stylosanthes scabra]
KMKEPLKLLKIKFGNLDDRIKVLEEEIEKIERELELKINEEENVIRRDALKNHVEVWYRRRAEYWKQHSRDRYV